MKSHIRLAHAVTTLIVMGCCIQVQAISQTLTFDQAVTMGTSLKDCPKRSVGLIESVSLSDSEGNADVVRPDKPIYLVFRSAAATDVPVVGPLATRPTEQQLQALRGQRTCVISD